MSALAGDPHAAGGSSVLGGAPAGERPRVLVLGGGLAGIVAALDCAEAGAEVALLEVRRRLGGAAYSFERDGLTLDNGQHVFLRCCRAYRALLARLGSERLTTMQPRLRIPVLSPGGRPALLRRGALPAPFHLAGALARYPHLRPARRLGAARAALALARLDPNDPALEARTLGSWLAGYGQDAAAVAALWDLVALPTMNVRAAEASLALAAFVFQTGLLASNDAGDIGFHDAGLGEILDRPARHALRAAGVQVRLGWRAQRLERDAGGFRAHGLEAAGASCERAHAVVVALPHQRAAALLEGLLAPTARALRALPSSPIVNLHVLFDRRVCEQPFAAGVGTPVQYLFDRSRAAGAPPGCQYLAVSLSGADAEMKLSVAQLRERYLPAIAQLLPQARTARVERFVVTREHAATFRAAPGVAALRPAALTAVPGLVLAGAYTDTGWPATLEGAALSGHAAAREVARALGLRRDGAGARTGSTATPRAGAAAQEALAR
ncbi:MAG TPA: hydroxysqualene dehydroxylase HpnE [Solirubrobacteraceae bacterium]|nr:hydroxysqualene dehydroxylase HpnE [Solirubrobacteraceae bacterium]